MRRYVELLKITAVCFDIPIHSYSKFMNILDTKLIYLLPYFPNFSPIEQIFYTIKA